MCRGSKFIPPPSSFLLTQTQAFNALNGDTTTWARIYPLLAAYWDVALPPPTTHFSSPAPRPFKLTLDTPAPYPSPFKSQLELRNSLQAWAVEEKVVQAWERIAQREGLDAEVFGQASWGFADAALALGWSVVLDGNKVCCNLLGFFLFSFAFFLFGLFSCVRIILRFRDITPTERRER
jgi:hypothetical protein